MLPWQLQLQYNPNHKKFSSLYNTVVVNFFHIFTHGDVVNAQTSEVSPQKQSSQATLRFTTAFKVG